MKKPIRIIKIKEQNEIDIRFWPTDICNFNCSYCFPDSHPGKFRYPPDKDLVVRNFRKLFNFYPLGSIFNLNISGGGEPTLWPSLESFCEEIKQEHSVKISLVSNGSRTLRWWSDNSKFFDDVVLSYHHEFTDIEHFIKVADFLFESGIKVTAAVLMDAKNWDLCLNAIEKMKTSSQPWIIQTKEVVFSPGNDINSYSSEQLDYVKNSTKRIPNSDWLLNRLDDYRLHQSAVLFDDESIELAKHHSIITNNWTNFKGWKCNVGRESLLITSSGDVLGSCQVSVFSKDVNIYKDIKVDQPLEVLCPKISCDCQPDTHISKIKI